MARYPRIDQPCPLDAQAQQGIGGHCGQCGKTVHCLDGRSDAERAELLRRANGPICVSYRLAMGTALALAIAAPAVAGPADVAAASGSSQAVLAPPNAASQAQTPVAAENPLEPDMQVVFVGGVSRPDDAAWIDDGNDDLPELPMRREPPPGG
ncbi:hypothetical protein J5226_03850 [Lysobacter sp. K5869]|uniref:hypothetical protein n=1 Tax=Lysobacter sp. K5869 TaxID=2820808 RepID=UPI001C05F320|nr:hypothetical protein [Lysobacter sp. K5869]QWP77551.1 hypothetical protein J5226_03850 [Lysobacter sp. K5869]